MSTSLQVSLDQLSITFPSAVMTFPHLPPLNVTFVTSIIHPESPLLNLVTFFTFCFAIVIGNKKIQQNEVLFKNSGLLLPLHLVLLTLPRFISIWKRKEKNVLI